MDKSKLDRAIFLRGKIKDIEDFIGVHRNNVRMNIKSFGTISTDRDCSISLEKNRQKEVIDMLTKWLDEYKKEFENL